MFVRLSVQGLESSVNKEIQMEKLVNSKDKNIQNSYSVIVQQELS